MFSYIIHQPNEDQEHLFYGHILDNFLICFSPQLAILEHKDAIRAELARQKTLRGVTTVKELLVIREEQKGL